MWTTDAKRAYQAIAEIETDIREGRVPETVGTFADLHDFVDANEYGGFCDGDPDGPEWEALVESCGRVQAFLDQWLRLGRPALRGSLPSGEYAAVWPIEGSRGVQAVFWGSEDDHDADWETYEGDEGWTDLATCSIATDTLAEALAEIDPTAPINQPNNH